VRLNLLLLCDSDINNSSIFKSCILGSTTINCLEINFIGKLVKNVCSQLFTEGTVRSLGLEELTRVHCQSLILMNYFNHAVLRSLTVIYVVL